MTNELIRAGHRHFGAAYLILVEDGASPACDDPDLPGDVLRVTIATGRQVELRDGPAEEFRGALADRESPGSTIRSEAVPSPSRRRPAPPGRRRSVGSE